VDPEARVAETARQSDFLRAAAIAAGPDAPVPTCPEWTVRDLVRHLGDAHGLALAALAEPVGGSRPAVPPPADDSWAAALARWDDTRARLLDRLAATPADAPCWTFPSCGETAAFWLRREVHETAIHRLDAEYAAGTADAVRYDPAVAVNGLGETLGTLVRVLQIFVPRDPGPALTSRWHSTDTGHTWLVRIDGGTAECRETGRGEPDGEPADVTATGTADALYRLAYGRPSRAAITGDAGALAAFRPI
jgi:uncharacterized protein (TIGR03083 family)